MAFMPDRNIWISSRVPQNLACTDCGRTSKFVAFHQPDRYEYNCSGCKATKLLTLSQINAVESSRFHRMPAAVVPPIITFKAAHSMKP
jgi:hypothetical protein